MLIIYCLPALAQENQAITSIQRAYEAHHLSRSQKVQFQLFAGLEPDNIPAAYRPVNPQRCAIKCATPFIMEYQQAFSGPEVPEINRIIKAPTQQAKQRQYGYF